MEYAIQQTKKEIKVLQNGIILITAKTNLSWTGRYELKFYIEDELVLVSSYYIIALWKFIRIKYQKLNASIRVYKRKYLKINDDIYGIVWNHFKDKTCIIKVNNIPAAELIIRKTVKDWYLASPDSRTFYFHTYANENGKDLFCLIRLLVEFPHIYS